MLSTKDKKVSQKFSGYDYVISFATKKEKTSYENANNLRVDTFKFLHERYTN